MGCLQVTGKDDEAEYVKKTTNTTKSPTIPQAQPQGNEMAAFNQSALDQHNLYRKKHHADPLRLNQDLVKIAQDYANEMIKKNDDKHSECLWGEKIIGENLYITIHQPFTGKEMSEKFYEDIRHFDFHQGICEPKAVRFTQMIWKGTTEVGFGYAKTSTGKYYGVANYFPAGNILGEFTSNIEREN